MITARDIKKRFGRYPALNGVSIDIEKGELLALLGPSGSGKTTLLRVIAGLEFPEAGQILFDGADMTFAGASARGVGFVFQQYALFRHMTVAKNIAFGLDVRRGRAKPSRAEIAAKVEELLRLVELEGLGKRFPNQLSGGQRQRVALARALAVDPQLLLLDEPFGALDATVRKSLRKELRRIHDATGVTTIFVTHDQEEALELADRVAILNLGQIEQVGTPQAVHDAPVSPFVCGFVGAANRFEGAVRGGRFEAGDVVLPSGSLPDGPSVGFLRPHELAIGDGGFEAVARRITAQGPVLQVEATTRSGQHIEAAFARQGADGLTPGATLKLKPLKAHVYPV
jgi:sulfate transport system ATP-binding protein